MSKLVMALRLSGTLTRTISVSQPPYDCVSAKYEENCKPKIEEMQWQSIFPFKTH